MFNTPQELKEKFLSGQPYDEDYCVETCVQGTEYGVDGVFVDGEFKLILLRGKKNTPPPYRECVEYYSVIETDKNAEFFRKTKELIAICNEKGISLEAEVGGIGGEEDGVVSTGECADPEECKQINDLGVTMLACGIGNIHGKYPANWAGLQFNVLESIKAVTGDRPLVLHGGSGIPDEQIKKAIDMGVAKVNVNTELQLVFADATRKYIEAGKDLEGKGYDPRKLLAPGAAAIRAEVKDRVAVFGSANKA